MASWHKKAKQSTLTKADLKRIEDLHKKVAADKVAVAKEKVALKKQKKEIEAERKKLAGQWKELKNARKQAQLGHEFKVGVAQKEAQKAAKGGQSGNLKRLQEQLLEMKTKLNHESKRARQHKMEVDQLSAENKVLHKKLKNLQNRKGKGEDPRVKHLAHENKMLKKQLKLLMIELNKKRRWFQRCIKSFKNNRSKWIKNQEAALKKKGVLVKYVFLDDVKQIKQYRDPNAKGKGKAGKGKTRFKNKIKVKSRDGGVIVLKDVEIVVLDGDADDNDDAGDDKKRRKKKSKGQALDEMEAYLAQIEQEIEEDQAALGGGSSAEQKAQDGDDDAEDSDGDFDMDEDAGDLDGDFEAANSSPEALSPEAAGSIDGGDNAALAAQMVWLKKELDDRTDDVEALREMVSDAQSHPEPKATVQRLVEAMQQRGEELAGKMENELYAKPQDVEEVKAGNERWQTWFASLAEAIANNGALFSGLLSVYDCFLDELKGRLADVDAVNTHFYTDKGRAEEAEAAEAGADNDADAEAGGDVGGDAESNPTIQPTDSSFYAEQKDEEDEDEQDKDGDCDGDAAEEKETEQEAAARDDVAVLAALRQKVAARHSEITEQFATLTAKEQAAEEAAEQEAADDFGAEDARKEALDANQEQVRKVREALQTNNGEWRELMMAVSTDYARMEEQRQGLVEGIANSQRELKAFIDLVVKIPKRKILDADAVGDAGDAADAGDAKEDQGDQEDEEEAAAEEEAQPEADNEDGDQQEQEQEEEEQEAEDAQEDADADGDEDGDGDGDGDGDDE